MKPVRHIHGIAAPLDRENVDTDAIMPKQFLVSTERTGYGAHLFDAWRFTDPGHPGQDPATRVPNPDFVLNEPAYRAGAGRRRQFRLRLQPRACGLGARRPGHQGGDRAELL